MLKVKVTRTSIFDNDKQPIPDAYMETWISPYNGATIKEWFIDLDESEIIPFVDKYGSVILSKGNKGYELEIYDDYRE